MLVNQGVIPPISPAAALRGGDVLDPEESTNWTFGVYFTAGVFDVTVDYFDIDVEDRLSLSSDFVLTAADVATLAGQGIDASDISEFRFFTNQFDTNTSGIDIVVSADTEWGGGVTTWNFAFNYTDTDVTDRDPTLLGDSRVMLIEDGTPETRFNLTANHNWNQWRFLARLNFYDEWFDNEATLDPPAPPAVFDSELLVDLEVEYSFNENMDITVGARNVFDNQGCKTDDCDGLPASVLGLPYSQFTPFGFNGAFWYGRLTYNFD